jgi:hypothetical protein
VKERADAAWVEAMTEFMVRVLHSRLLLGLIPNKFDRLPHPKPFAFSPFSGV